MTNAERILRELDSHLDHEVRLVLYGRAAIALGFEESPEGAKHSLDVDVIIPMSQVDVFRRDEHFWDAQEATNRNLKKEGLYVTHLFEAKEVFLRRDWEEHLVPIALPGLRWIRLFRPATLDFILTKMMRGNDEQDMADVKFLVLQDHISPADLETAFANMVIPDIVELRDAFERAKPVVLKIARTANTS